MRRFQVGDLILRRDSHNKGVLDLSWKGPYKIAGVLTPGAYQLANLNRDQISRLWNTDYLRIYYQWLYAPLSIKFTIWKTKVQKLMSWILNLGGTWSEMQNQRKKENDFPKKTSKLPQKQPTKKKSWRAADRFRSEGCEDGWLRWGSCWAGPIT